MYVSESVLETTQYPVFLYVYDKSHSLYPTTRIRMALKYFCSVEQSIIDMVIL